MTAALIVVGLLAGLFLGTTLYLGQAILRQSDLHAREVVAAVGEERLRVAELHKAEIERLQNMKQVGLPVLPEAKVLTETIEPEARLSREISEDVLARATAAIMEEYRAINIPITEAEARAQAEQALLQGVIT